MPALIVLGCGTWDTRSRPCQRRSRRLRCDDAEGLFINDGLGLRGTVARDWTVGHLRWLGWTSAWLFSACGREAGSSTSSGAAGESPSSPQIILQVLSSDAKASTLKVKGAGLPAPDADGTEVLQVAMGDAEVPLMRVIRCVAN